MLNILIVEDHAIVREPLSRLLEMEGYRTFQCANGIEALALLEREPVNLVLLDLIMPKKDGLAILEAMRSDDRWRELPVILMTSMIEGSQLQRARDLHVDSILFKARFNIEELFAQIRARLAA